MKITKRKDGSEWYGRRKVSRIHKKMIDYQLLEECKKKGLKTKGKCPDCIGDSQKSCSNDIYPTLEEAIEACGDKFVCFSRSFMEDGSAYWVAFAFAGEIHDTDNMTPAQGPSPLEAVLRLYIAIKQ